MIQVLNRALDILEYIAQTEGKPQQLRDIAAHLGLHEATCANILKTLAARDYVEQAKRGAGYTLGPMAYYLPRDKDYRPALVKTAKPHIDTLSLKLNESCILTILHNVKRYVLYHVECQQVLMVHREHFLSKNFYESASARLLLSYATDEEVKQIIDQHGLPGEEWTEARKIRQLDAARLNIREQGYAEVITASHIAGIAVPIFENERVIASLSVYLPSIRYREDRRAKILEALLSTSEKVSKGHAAWINY